MATQTRRRTISPETRASGSNRYKIDTKNVLTGDTLIVEVDHATKSFKKRFTFSGKDIGHKKSISFSVDERGNNIDISWSGVNPIKQGKSIAINKVQAEKQSNQKVEVSESEIIQSLEPVINELTKVVILGTMPGVESLKQQAYYSHPRNLFWKLIAEVTGQEVPLNYDDRTVFLLDHKIGLWDICKSCVREGSLDSNISEETPTDLKALVAKYPNIECLAFNGQKAEKLFKKHFGSIPDIELLSLPSTSPANAGVSWEEKVERWETINAHLN